MANDWDEIIYDGNGMVITANAAKRFIDANGLSGLAEDSFWQAYRAACMYLSKEELDHLNMRSRQHHAYRHQLLYSNYMR